MSLLRKETQAAAPNLRREGEAMSDFKQYRRSQIAELAEWTQDTDMRDVSVSVVDK